MKTIICICIVVCLLSPVLADAKNIAIAIPMRSVSVRSSERGNLYVFSLDVPAELSGKRLDSVFLEFAVDVEPSEGVEAEAGPLMAVYPLVEALGPAVPQYRSDVPSLQPLPAQDNRVVRMDITDIVKGWMAEPSSNHGLVIGSFAGPQLGTATLKDELPDAQAAIRVTYFYQNRFGNRVSSQD